MLNIKYIIANHQASKLYFEPNKNKRISGLKKIESKFDIKINKNFKKNIHKGSYNTKDSCILNFS